MNEDIKLLNTPCHGFGQKYRTNQVYMTSAEFFNSGQILRGQVNITHPGNYHSDMRTLTHGHIQSTEKMGKLGASSWIPISWRMPNCLTFFYGTPARGIQLFKVFWVNQWVCIALRVTHLGSVPVRLALKIAEGNFGTADSSTSRVQDLGF